MSAIMSQNGRKMAKIMHNAVKKFDWAKSEITMTESNGLRPANQHGFCLLRVEPHICTTSDTRT